MRKGTKRRLGTVCSPLRTVTQEAEASRCCVLPAPEVIPINRTISGGKASWIWSAFISELNPLCNGADGWCACVCEYLHGCAYWRFDLSQNYRYSKSTKVKMFSRVCVNDLCLSTPFHCLMVSIMTSHIYCVVCLSKTKHHMATLYKSRLAGLAVRCTNQTAHWQTKKERELCFPSLQPSLADYLILSVLIFHCFVQLRGERLESCGCRHVSVCLSVCGAVCSGRASLIPWQMLWAPNNASPANKCTQLTTHGTSYRHIV